MTNNRNLGHTDWMRRKCWMKQYFLRFSGATWSENPALTNFSDRMSPFFEIKFQLSCHVSFNPVPRSLMSQGSPSWTVKVAGTTSPVLEDTAWSTAARPISQYRTSRQRSLHVCNLSIFRWKYGIKSSRLRSGSSSLMSLMFQLVSTLPNFQCTSRCIAPSIRWKAWISVNWGLTVYSFNSEVFALGTLPWQRSWLREAACTKAPRACDFEHT